MLRQHREFNLAGLLFRKPTVLSMAVICLISSPALAQLRSGSQNRALYNKSESLRTRVNDDEPDESETNQTPSSYQPTQSKVVPASHQVREAEVVRVSSPRATSRKSVTSNVQLAGCKSCGTGVSRAYTGSTVIDEPSPLIDGMAGESIENDSGYTHEIAGCDSGCCDPCDSFGDYYGPSCGPGPIQSLLSRLSVRAEAPLFWRRPQSTPPLVTTATAGTGSDLAGELGQNTTQILRTGIYNDQARAGGRITVSTWLDPNEYHGLSFRYWNAGNFNDSTTFDSANFPILARPFVNTTVAVVPPAAFPQDTQLIAFPGDSVGSINVNSSSKLYGFDIIARKMVYADRFTRFDWIYGYQHTSLGERLQIASQTTVTGNAGGLQGSSISVTDNFQTQNRLHGFALGFLSTRRVGCFQFESTFRLISGNLERQVRINGSTTTVAGGATNTTAQGLLARNTNTRDIKSNTFALAPEVGVNLAYAIGPNLDFTIGYNYLMIPKVAQASRQINRNLRVNLSDPLTGSQDPSFPFTTSRYWVRSLGLGAQLRY